MGSKEALYIGGGCRHLHMPCCQPQRCLSHLSSSFGNKTSQEKECSCQRGMAAHKKEAPKGGMEVEIRIAGNDEQTMHSWSNQLLSSCI